MWAPVRTDQVAGPRVRSSMARTSKEQRTALETPRADVYRRSRVYAGQRRNSSRRMLQLEQCMRVLDRVVVHAIASTDGCKPILMIYIAWQSYVCHDWDCMLPSNSCRVCATRIAIMVPRHLILQKHVSIDRSTFNLLMAHHQTFDIQQPYGNVDVLYARYMS